MHQCDSGARSGKFAEGDSRVLMLKMARDRVRRAAKDLKAGKAPPAGQEDEAARAAALLAALAPAKGDKAAEARLWDENWREVYALAETMMARTMAEVMGE